jgi:hypothetical protein
MMDTRLLSCATCEGKKTVHAVAGRWERVGKEYAHYATCMECGSEVEVEGLKRSKLEQADQATRPAK